MISDLTHRLLDLAEEDYRVKVLQEESRGSTGRGISAAYSEETGHWQMYFLGLPRRPEFLRAQARPAGRPRVPDDPARLPRDARPSWHGFFDRLTEAEQRANAEAIAGGVFGEDEFDFTQFRGKASPSARISSA
jgi:adenylosuccinate synthase